MKLLIVLVSALVLVAHGKAAPSSEEERLPQVQAEVVTGYAVVDAGQEAGDVEPEAEFAEAAPAVDEPRVVGAGPQRAFGLEEFAGELNAYVPQTVYIPIISRACTDSACVQICNLLGFKNGVCLSTTTCQCYN